MDFSYEKILIEDRHQANKYVLIMMNALGWIMLAVLGLGYFNVLSFTSGLSFYLLPVSSIILFLPEVINLFFKLSNKSGDGRSLTIVINICCFLSAVIISASASIYSSFVWFFAFFVAIQYHTKRFERLLKKHRLMMMAHEAKQSLEALSEFPDTFETDCKIKVRYLAKNDIDVDTALLAMDNNIEKYNDFVLTFVGESHRKLEELGSLLDSDTLLQYGAKVHALRVKANALGLKNLTDTAFFHEMEAYAGNVEIVKANWDKLSEEWEEAYILFNDYIQSIGLKNHAYDKTGNQISFQEWGEQLNEAFEALDDYDTIRARDILKHLLQYQIDSDITQKLSMIVANIDDILKA